MSVSIFDPEEFHTLALSLVGGSPNESALRTAISREYYACFLLAMRKLMEKGFVPHAAVSDHGAVQRELKRRNKRSLADRLEALRQKRERADYHLSAEEDRTNGGCTLCSAVRVHTPGACGPAVQFTLWEDTKAVASGLLPTLRSL